jgi:hypothetical protein
MSRPIATLLAAVALAGGVAFFIQPRGGQREAIDQLAAQARIAVIAEQPVPPPLADSGSWTPAGVAMLGMQRDQLVEELTRRPVPLPGFERRRPPIPIWVVETLPSGGQRVVPQTYIECGTMPSDFVLPWSEGQSRAFYDLPVSFPDPTASTAGAWGANVDARVGISELPGTGAGVLVGVVDSGFIHGHRRPHKCTDTGALPCLDENLSFPQGIAGQAGAGHGAMVAYDVTITAPDVTLADLVLPQGNSWLCDAAALHERLVPAIQGGLFSRYKGAVLVNAWQIYDPSAPGGKEFNDPAHPLNRTISALDALGVDVVFAAGNCGPGSSLADCTVKGETIYGSNSHPGVLTVGAATLGAETAAAGYSAIGPGQPGLSRMKPDLLGLSDFIGSRLWGANRPDTHTSAATGLVAGIVAAYRSAYPYDPKDASTHPSAVRDVMRRKSEPCHGPARQHDYARGWGLLTAHCGLRP